MGKDSKTKVIAVAIACLFAPYLLVAIMTIPAGVARPGHYNIGNNLVAAVFFSYAALTASLAPLVGIVMYSAYAYAALARLRRLGLLLFVIHYAAAFGVVVPYYLSRAPDLITTSHRQWSLLAERPASMLFIFGPFILANLVYLVRLMTSPPVVAQKPGQNNEP